MTHTIHYLSISFINVRRCSSFDPSITSHQISTERIILAFKISIGRTFLTILSTRYLGVFERYLRTLVVPTDSHSNTIRPLVSNRYYREQESLVFDRSERLVPGHHSSIEFFEIRMLSCHDFPQRNSVAVDVHRTVVSLAANYFGSPEK